MGQDRKIASAIVIYAILFVLTNFVNKVHVHTFYTCQILIVSFISYYLQFYIWNSLFLLLTKEQLKKYHLDVFYVKKKNVLCTKNYFLLWQLSHFVFFSRSMFSQFWISNTQLCFKGRYLKSFYLFQASLHGALHSNFYFENVLRFGNWYMYMCVSIYSTMIIFTLKNIANLL